MEIHELLKLTEKEVEVLPLIEQVLYWQHKYHAVCTTLGTLISSSRAISFSDIMTENEILEKYGGDIYKDYKKTQNTNT